jgi:hypothetical protein
MMEIDKSKRRMAHLKDVFRMVLIDMLGDPEADPQESFSWAIQELYEVSMNPELGRPKRSA